MGIALIAVKVKCLGAEACGENSPQRSLLLIESRSEILQTENGLKELQVSAHSEYCGNINLVIWYTKYINKQTKTFAFLSLSIVYTTEVGANGY